jgi:hypothetical protein
VVVCFGDLVWLLAPRFDARVVVVVAARERSGRPTAG